MKSAMTGPALLNDAHVKLRELGWKLLQPYRFGGSDEEHVEELLRMADFPKGATVLDVGCGVGECSRLMKLSRPDLTFVLVNFSAAQLADCPVEFEQHLASAHDLPFEDGKFDAVMFNAALGNMDAMVALAEASRVLKVGGVLFLNEVRRIDGDNDAMQSILQFRAYDHDEILDFCEDMGLYGQAEKAPTHTEYLRSVMDDASYLAAFSGTEPGVWRLVKEKNTIAADYGALFGRNDSVALQVSGGKDSLTVLHAMKPWWDRLCVYWLNPGDPFPETVKLMGQLRSVVPNFREVAGCQKEIIAADGWPSDVVPVRWTTSGQFVFGEKPFKVQGRLDCCYRSLMAPMHEAMARDGVNCIIRGKRSEEADKSPTRSGDVVDGMELVYPLWDWTGEEVIEYLAVNGVELPESYKHASHSLDCMSCTAWWGEGLSKYLAAEHPDHFIEYSRRVGLIKSAVAEELTNCEV